MRSCPRWASSRNHEPSVRWLELEYTRQSTTTNQHRVQRQSFLSNDDASSNVPSLELLSTSCNQTNKCYPQGHSASNVAARKVKCNLDAFLRKMHHTRSHEQVASESFNFFLVPSQIRTQASFSSQHLYPLSRPLSTRD